MTQVSQMQPKQPNFFQRRWEWHTRVVEFEKKYEAIHPQQVVRPTADDYYFQTILAVLKKIPVVPAPEPAPEPAPAPKYKNRVIYSIMRFGDLTEYLVTLKLDNSDDLYEDVEETKVFKTEQDALACLNAMKPFKTLLPQCALAEFQKY